MFLRAFDFSRLIAGVLRYSGGTSTEWWRIRFKMAEIEYRLEVYILCDTNNSRTHYRYLTLVGGHSNPLADRI